MTQELRGTRKHHLNKICVGILFEVQRLKRNYADTTKQGKNVHSATNATTLMVSTNLNSLEF